MVSGCRALEPADEAPEGLGLEVAVGVGDEGPGQAEDARIALQGTVGQLGELAVEPGREIRRIDRSVSSTTWKLSRNHSAAGVSAPSSPITAAIER